MIIVKTTNGDRFINEAETLQMNHIKDKAQVEVWPSRWGNQQQQPQYYLIENVEGVTFISNTQPACISDEGSEVARLLKSCNEKAEYIDKLTKQLKTVKDDLLHFAFDMEQIVCHYHDQIPSDICKQIQTPALDLKSKVLNDKYRDIS